MKNNTKLIICAGCKTPNKINMNKVRLLKGAYFPCKGCHYRYIFVSSDIVN